MGAGVWLHAVGNEQQLAKFVERIYATALGPGVRDALLPDISRHPHSDVGILHTPCLSTGGAGGLVGRPERMPPPPGPARNVGLKKSPKAYRKQLILKAAVKENVQKAKARTAVETIKEAA